MHRLRPVHRGLPDPLADDDQLLRAGRRQPAGPDLHQGAADGAAAAGHGAAAAPDAPGRDRAGLLRPGPDAGPQRRQGRPGGGAGQVSAPLIDVALILAQAPAPAPAPDVVTTGEAIVFWVLGPIALLGALGMVF